MIENNWHSLQIADVFERVKSEEQGLSNEEALKRLKEFGPNALPESKPDSFFTIFLRQFKSPLIYILLLAVVAVLAMGEFVDGIIIFAILFFNAVVGTIQEGRAQNTLLALKKFTETKATVFREKKESIILDKNVVVGDVIVLREGEKVPADARIILSNNFKVNESALSGESTPVDKTPEILKRKYKNTWEQKNMLFKGTEVLSGSARAVVVATGIDTTIGKIAKEITTIDTEIPLKKDVRFLSRFIIFSVLLLDVLLFFAGISHGKSIKEMFMTLVSLSVSVVPEGLPIVMTLILAAGVWRMSKRNALVRRLQAVEALGQAEIIAVDKTGTITKNELVVQKLFVGNDFFEVSGEGYEPKGDITKNEKLIDPLNHPDLIFMVKNAALCAQARTNFLDTENKWVVLGDPTEASMLVLAQKIGFKKDVLETEAPLITDFPFDYNLRMRASLRKINGKRNLIIAGAPENVLNICTKVWHAGKNYRLSYKEREKLQNVFESMSAEGLRVVALGIKNRPTEGAPLNDAKDISFVGFIGMKDSLRKEVPEAMKLATSAGVRVIMITGDHKITAMAIAKEAGIYKDGDDVITGEQLDKADDNELLGIIKRVSVFARVSPSHKLRIINAFRAAKKIIAMTGDGVNDAPSLVSADLGVAMGKIGTEVAKEASDIVILDDDFGSIILAMEEGRSIYKTIKKVILYLFSTSFGEVLTITGAIFLGFPLPILPVHIIWLNFVTDGFLDVSLAMETKEKNILSEKFVKPNKYLVDFLMAQRIFIMGIIMMFGTLFIFKGIFQDNLLKAKTMSLVVLAVFQWLNAWNCRSENKSVFTINPLNNKFLVAATATVIILQLLAVYNPFMQKILQTTPIGIYDWILCVAVALSIVVIEEIRKLVYGAIKNKISVSKKVATS